MEEVKSRIKIVLDSENLNFYEDFSGNIVKKLSQTRESLDKKKIRELLGEIQYKTVVKTTTFESLRIQSAESKERQMKFLKEKR
jgi:CRISPR/Cas system CSM-associated protein Csm5 (group 7 of RAMP superfamily)